MIISQKTAAWAIIAFVAILVLSEIFAYVEMVYDPAGYVGTLKDVH